MALMVFHWKWQDLRFWSRLCQNKNNREETMSASNPSPAIISWSVQERLREYVRSRQLAEIVYRDPAGQICVVHEVIRDLLSRAGHDFLVLGKSKVVGVEHVIMVDGQRLTKE
jgi:hypothetical protein